MNVLQPHDIVSVTLTAAQWNQIIDALHLAPYGIAVPLIQAIVQQGQASVAKPEPAPGPRLVQPEESEANPSAAE